MDSSLDGPRYKPTLFVCFGSVTAFVPGVNSLCRPYRELHYHPGHSSPPPPPPPPPRTFGSLCVPFPPFPVFHASCIRSVPFPVLPAYTNILPSRPIWSVPSFFFHHKGKGIWFIVLYRSTLMFTQPSFPNRSVHTETISVPRGTFQSSRQHIAHKL